MADIIFDWRKSPKYQEELKKLPEELKEVFDEFVSDYSTATMEKYGKGYVAYAVLAELVKMGWKKDT